VKYPITIACDQHDARSRRGSGTGHHSEWAWLLREAEHLG